MSSRSRRGISACIRESEAHTRVRVTVRLMESHIQLLFRLKGEGNNMRQEHLCISDATLN